MQYRYPCYGYDVIANLLDGKYSCADWYECGMETQIYRGT
jgi:hypothetical protein